MTSIAESRSCSLNLDDSDVLSSDYIITESIEFTEDESHNVSVISALDKSALDIELEICEEILALDDNDGTSSNSNEQPFEINDLENIFDSPESVFESHPGACIAGSYQQGSKNIKPECSINVHESAFQSNEETCNDTAKEKIFEKNSKPLDCESHSKIKKSDCNSQDLPSSSIVSEDEFDSEIKKCWNILKHEEPSDIGASNYLSQIPQLAQSNNASDSLSILTEREIKSEKIESSILAEIIIKSENITVDAPVHLGRIQQLAQSNATNPWNILTEKEIKSENIETPIPVEAVVKLENIPLPISEETDDKKYKKRNCEESSDSDSVSIVYESNGIKSKKLKSVIQAPEVKWEKDEDELSLFAETDISTVEEEYEGVEGPDSPQSYKENSNSKQDDAVTKRVSPQSVVVLPETDYLDAERDDINDSGWESMKNLSSEEERYKLVRKTWESSKIPDPNRNLTYHSYRKRHLKNSAAPPIARKRKATSSLDVTHINSSKRQRSCTFLYDLNIDSLSAEKQKKKAVINNQMQREVNQLNNIYFEQEKRIQKDYYERRNTNAYGQIYNLRHKCQREMESIKQQYHSMSNQCSYELDSGIHKLNKARNEVLQFFKFYKGLNSEDPTVLTASQLQELEDIENIYLQFDKLYKR